MAESPDRGGFAPSGPISRAVALACTVLALLAGFLFVIESVMSVVSVAGRALFSRPVPGDYELVQMFSAMAIAMCLPYCQLQRGHVFVDFFTLWAPPLLKRLLDALAALLLAGSAFFLAWRVWQGMLDMREYGETSMVIALPVWWGYVPVVPSFVLLGIAALVSFVDDVKGRAAA